jgi:hypothetical protein
MDDIVQLKILGPESEFLKSTTIAQNVGSNAVARQWESLPAHKLMPGRRPFSPKRLSELPLADLEWA